MSRSAAPRPPDANFRLLFDPDNYISVHAPGVECGTINLRACLTEEELVGVISCIAMQLRAVGEVTPLVSRETLESLWVKLFAFG